MSVDDGPGSAAGPGAGAGAGPGGAPGTGLSLKCTYPITDDMPWDQPLVIADPDIEVREYIEQ
jgi:hypothetical protein